MLKVFAVAGLLSLAAIMPASAGPLAPAVPLNELVSSDVIQVQHHHRHHSRHHNRHHERHHHGHHRRHHPHVTHYRAGHRYHAAPRHYRRYHARPADWNRRGCIMVGPLWFCP